jgi:gliding motility associated protien GldN
MKIKWLCLLVLLIPIAVLGQDMPGKWSGVLTQDGKSFKIDITISQQGKNLTGTSRSTDDNGDFVEEKFTGISDGLNITINENEVTKCPEGLKCALKSLTGHFKIDSLNKKIVIEGEWTSNKIFQNKQYIPAVPSSGKFSITPTTSAVPIGITPATLARPIGITPTISNRPLDGYYKKTNIKNAKVTPLPVLREADVVYSRRIWQEIDLREKMNQYLVAPKSRLIDALMDAIATGQLTAYDPIPTKDDPDGDEFSFPLTPEKAKLKMADSSVVSTFDKNGDKSGSKMVAGEFNPDSVLKFRIKEDVVFDKQRSVEEYRIIGIAPLIRQKVEGEAGLSFDYQPAFWLYFPQVRQVLVNKEVVNNRNDAPGLSFDDVFTKRLFKAYVVKQSNPLDERIKDHAIGIDRLYESEKIKKSLMDWELNLWQY